MIERIIITGDVFRVTSFANDITDMFVKHVYNIFSRQIVDATNLPVIISLSNDEHIFDRIKFLDIIGFNNLTENDWIKLYKTEPNDESVAYFKECFKNSLIIFQEGGVMKKIAQKANIPYINMYVSAIRFLDDLHFAFQTNVPEIAEKLSKHIVTEDEILFNANKIKIYYGEKCRYKYNYMQNSLLLCGQNIQDSSLIKNGKMVSFLDYQDEINDLFQQYSLVYYKKHPFVCSKDVNERFVELFSNVKVTNDSFYKMCCSDEIIGITALSSGCLEEAKYFGKKIHTISHKYASYYDGKVIKKDDYFTINNGYFMPLFWSEILSPVCKTNKFANDFVFNGRENFLRSLFNMWWGYEIGKQKVVKNTISNLTHTLKNGGFKKVVRHYLALLIPTRKLRHKVRGRY